MGRLTKTLGILWNDVLGHPLIAVLLVAAPFGWAWWHHKTAALAIPGVTVQTQPLEALKRPGARVIYRTKYVYVYSHAAAAKVQAPAGGRLLAASELPASRRPYRVWAELRPSGRAHLFVRRDPYPWFALTHQGSVGVYEAIAPGGPEQILAADQDLLRIKAVTVQLRGTLATHTGWSAGIGLRYHW
ncbi:MAG: hypothetical protein ACYCVW_16715 [Rhodocyclaceae bacterium]